MRRVSGDNKRERESKEGQGMMTKGNEQGETNRHILYGSHGSASGLEVLLKPGRQRWLVGGRENERVTHLCEGEVHVRACVFDGGLLDRLSEDARTAEVRLHMKGIRRHFVSTP